ncbi:MAG: glucose 1-dehydrogenase [Bryobacterales bacterium]|nr:glucose 1-dehydrogenase [Bryobacterales bacterium]
MSKLNGKVAVVTGASKGIGAAIAKRLAADGAAVVVNYATSAAGAEKVVNEIQAAGGRAVAARADVSKPADVKALFDAAEKHFGTAEILINNAGVYAGAPLGGITEEHYRKHFDLNVFGLLSATQEAVARLRGRQAVVVNISSTVALTPPAGMSVYSATKAAVDNITRSLALELGPKARVVSVAPGLTVTEGFRTMQEGSDGSFEQYAVSRTPLARVGTPEDIANVVSFAVSPDAAWISGEVIQAGGGIRI